MRAMPRPKRSPLTISELNALIPRLAATAAMLEDLARSYAAASSGGARGSGGAGGGKRVGRGRSRSGGAAIRDKLLAALKGGKGLGLGAIVAKLGLDRGAVKYHLRALRAQKKARVVGDRNKARWLAT